MVRVRQCVYLVAAAAVIAVAPATATAGAAPADGSISADQPITPFDVSSPAVARLDPALRTAVQEAARTAARDGIDMRINSGWRTEQLQQQMLDDAVRKYGSFEVARQWVATPAESHHVTGGAVDVGPPAAANWLIRNGSQFGLCQIYANENWHFELAADERGDCPTLKPNAAA